MISFVSSIKSTGVTGNMAAMGIAAVLDAPKKIILFENHVSCNNLGKYLFPAEYGTFCCGEEAFLSAYNQNINARKNLKNIQYTGSIEKIKRRKYDREIIHNDMFLIELLEDSLYYCKDAHDSEALCDLDYGFRAASTDLIRSARENFENEGNARIYVDTRLKGSISAKYVIDGSSLVVVNLPQEEFAVEEYLVNYASILDKTVFMFSDYYRNGALSADRIISNYGLNVNRVMIMPHCDEYAYAVKNGHLIEYISGQYNCRPTSESYYFISELKKNVRMLDELLGMKYCGHCSYSHLIQERGAMYK